MVFQVRVSDPHGYSRDTHDGPCLSKFWGWFIVPRFDVKPLTYMQAVGVLMTSGLFLLGLYMQSAAKEVFKDSNYDTATKGIVQNFTVTMFLMPLALFTGWCWHHFIQ